jgi:hypothetical protein
MQKIMFNNEYGLTDAVRDGRKKMTRRTAYDGEIKDIHIGYMTEGVDAGRLALCDGNMIVAKSKYKLGEVVAVAQSYQTIEKEIRSLGLPLDLKENIAKHKGYTNKMFVKASDMPHQIKITDIKAERLQDISDEDCLREGIQAFDTPVGKVFVAGGVYVGQDARLKIAKGMINLAKTFKTPQGAFAVLIDRVSGKGTWEQNDWQFAYTFKLIK